MPRQPLTDEQRAQRQAERDAQQATKRRNTKKISPMADTSEINTELPAAETTPASTQTTESSAPVNTHTDTTPAPEPPASTGPAERKKYVPMSGDMKRRPYSTPKIDPALLDRDIPDPMATASTIQNTQSAADLLNKPITPAEPEKTTAQAMQEKTGFNKLSNADQKTAAATTADVVLSGYDQLHAFGRKWIKVKEQTLVEKHQKNELDLSDIVIPASAGQEELNLFQFFKEYNRQIDDEFKVSDSFKETVRPILERVASKYGLGMTDEWALAYHFGNDLVQKGAMMYGFKKMINGQLEAYSKMHQERLANTAAAAEKMYQERLAAENKLKVAADARLAEEKRQAAKTEPKVIKTDAQQPVVTPSNGKSRRKANKTEPLAI